MNRHIRIAINEDSIPQEITVIADDHIRNQQNVYNREIDDAFKFALIKLGWTPPPDMEIREVKYD